MIPRPPTSTLFPYTTLFRSQTRLEYGTLSMFVICTGKITDSSPVVTRLESQSGMIRRWENMYRYVQSLKALAIAVLLAAFLVPATRAGAAPGIAGGPGRTLSPGT